jgi:hypothetical protein
LEERSEPGCSPPERRRGDLAFRGLTDRPKRERSKQMHKIIVFRFHKSPDLCENRLRLLCRFNPGIPVFGLYGGRRDRFDLFRKRLHPFCKDIFPLTGMPPRWVWKHGDLALRRWYREVGRSIRFDRLHLIEWDLLLLDSLDRLYRKIPADGIGLTGLIRLSQVENRWTWTTRPGDRAAWLSLLADARTRFGYRGRPRASQGPGLCLPEAFLRAYCSVEVPEAGHDELRLPLYGQILGFRLYDTGFYRAWFSEEEDRLFNCDRKPIAPSLIRRELVHPAGRRAFHPFRSRWPLDTH